MSYELICSGFLGNRQSRPQDTIKLAFDEAKEIDPVDGISQLVSAMLRYIFFASTGPIKYVIKLGADMKIMKYMIDLGADPEIISNLGNLCQCLSDGRLILENPDVLRILLKNGMEPERTHINRLVHKLEYTLVLLDNGFDLKTILEQIADCSSLGLHDSRTADFIIDRMAKLDFVLGQDVLCRLLMVVMYFRPITVDIIDLFINAGVDLRCNNDQLFVESCKYKDATLTLYLLNNFDIDVNTHEGEAYNNAIRNRNQKTIQILLDRGFRLSAGNMRKALRLDADMVKTLIDFGDISYDAIAQQLVKSILMDTDISIFRLLIENGVDFNHLFQLYASKD